MIFAGDEVPYAGEPGPAFGRQRLRGDAYRCSELDRVAASDMLIGGQGR